MEMFAFLGRYRDYMTDDTVIAMQHKLDLLDNDEGGKNEK